MRPGITRKRITAAVVSLLCGIGLTTALTPAQAAPKPAPHATHVVSAADSIKGYPAGPGHPARETHPRSGEVHTLTTTGPYYYYAKASDTGITGADGTAVLMDVKTPQLLGIDSHTLAEHTLTGPGGNGNNAVEAGWTVDNAGVNGADHTNPHLFVFAWANNTADPRGYTTSGYNGSPFVVLAGAPISPGDVIANNAVIKLYWQHRDSTNGCSGSCVAGWYLGYSSVSPYTTSWVGYYPDSWWAGFAGAVTFNRIDFVQDFGEIAAGYDPTQTDMGNGHLADGVGQGAAMSGYALTACSGCTISGGGTYDNYVNQGPAGLPVSDRWPVHTTTTTNKFRYGGPGGNGNIAGFTSPGDDCSGVGVGTDPPGAGAVCLFNGTNGGKMVTVHKRYDGNTSGCVTNLGTADPGAPLGTAGVTNTRYATVEWYYTAANCTGSKDTIQYGQVNFSSANPDWRPAHASLKFTSTLVTCATGGWPNTAPATC